MFRLNLFLLLECFPAILLWFQLWWVGYINYLSKISSLCNETDSPNVFVVGDFNACPKNNFGQLLSQSFLEHELKTDKIMLPADSFTYVSDTHGTCSWLDYLVSSKSAHDSIQNTEILHQFIFSDHRPVAATIKTTALPQNILCDNKTQYEKNIKWNKVTQQQKFKYQQASKIWLSEDPYLKNLPHVTILCAKTNNTLIC